ncbi:hypothetical protein QJS04_geneDACA007484 [Acorus gramineus]|uniref:Uncharacterized protein n=1 Tax=Acorus gramineus TaxID=55184 RepID=A0AAV9B3T5_ACOGR|nr:hypothetical protein QJS04_geneDACA007484 [Acorus gramineus]
MTSGFWRRSLTGAHMVGAFEIFGYWGMNPLIPFLVVGGLCHLVHKVALNASKETPPT